MPTPAELAAAADAAEAEARAHDERGADLLTAGHGREAGREFAAALRLRERARVLREAVAAMQDVLPSGLPRTENQRTVVQMDAAARELKIGRAKVADHPFPRALYKRHMTVGEWAEKNRLSREKVSSWWKTGPGGRRIPKEWADRIRDEFGVPHSAWPNGVK